MRILFPSLAITDNPCLGLLPIHSSLGDASFGRGTSCNKTKSAPSDLTAGRILVRFLCAQFQVVIFNVARG